MVKSLTLVIVWLVLVNRQVILGFGISLSLFKIFSNSMWSSHIWIDSTSNSSCDWSRTKSVIVYLRIWTFLLPISSQNWTIFVQNSSPCVSSLITIPFDWTLLSPPFHIVSRNTHPLTLQIAVYSLHIIFCVQPSPQQWKRPVAKQQYVPSNTSSFGQSQSHLRWSTFLPDFKISSRKIHFFRHIHFSLIITNWI